MNVLNELAIKYKTDKWGKHNYTPVYYSMFRNKGKRKRVKKVLEIGVAEGAGLRMFRDFFTHAMIYGADNDPKRIISEDRIEVFFCDQSSKIYIGYLMEQIGFDLDLVVDDGSHIPEHQVFTAMSLLPGLKKGAIYVIEDVADKRIAEPLKEYNPVLLKVGKRYDDRLLIIRK